MPGQQVHVPACTCTCTVHIRMEMEENPHPKHTTLVVEEVVPRPLVGPVHPTHPLIYAGTKGGMGARDMAPLFSNLYIGISWTVEEETHW